MSTDEAYADWLHDVSYLTYAETVKLPRWHRTIAFVQQFAVMHLNDGAGSLFYNDPEKVSSVIAALNEIGEAELSKLVQATRRALGFWARFRFSQFKVAKQVMEEPIASMTNEIDRLIERRWDKLHGAMRSLADANGWQRGA
jgi:hypothetical protein